LPPPHILRVTTARRSACSARLQLLVFTTQALPLGLRSPQILFQLRDPMRLIVDDSLRIMRLRGLRGSVVLRPLHRYAAACIA
jgi:hypothetical protein